jgi:ADP-ribosyl-[dinitrogen reductase] hydrolase
MIAARLMAELGVDADTAIEEVRHVRAGAIETVAQEKVVRRARPQAEPIPDGSSEAILDRAVGALVGLAVGTTLEFSRRDDRTGRLTDMVGGGPFSLKVGEWTDDTAMALALADSLRAAGGFDAHDLMTRFVAWWKEGAYSSNGSCFDIGITTRESLARFQRSGDAFSGSTDGPKAGNGSLMRLAPVAIRYWNDAAARRRVAAEQSRTTHGAPEAVDACVVFADILADAIAGPRSIVMKPRIGGFAGRIAAIAAGSWRGKARADIRGSGYVAHALEASLWCVGRTSSFRDAVLLAANLREDADTTAAITWQLAGALYGLAGIPAAWRDRIALGPRIEQDARDLAAAAQQSGLK